MDAIETMKEAFAVFQKIDNLELQKQALALQSEVVGLYDENRNLKEENRALRERLTARAEMQFRENMYWRGEDGPFCSPCFDATGAVIRMHVSAGYYPKCPKCSTQAMPADAEPYKASPRVARQPWIPRR